MTLTNGSTRRVLTALFMILALLLPLGPVRNAIAQDVSEDGFTDEFTYESLFGYTLTWDETWELDSEGSGYYIADLADSLYFTQDNGVSSLSVVARPSIGSLASSVDFYSEYYGGVLDNAELVETEADKIEGRSLIRFDFDDVPHALYIRVFLSADKSTEIQAVVIGELDGFDDLLTSVQETIGLDDDPILADLDPAEALTLFEDGDPIPFPTPSGQLPDDEEEDDPSENEDIKLPDDEDPEATPTEEATDPEPTEDDEDVDSAPTEDDEDSESTPTEEDTDSDLSDEGLIAEGEYESPQFGVELTWSSDWETFPDGISSEEEFGVDQFSIVGTDLDATFYLSVFPIETLTAEAWAEQFEDLVEESPDNLAIVEQSVVDDVQLLFYSFEFDGQSGYGVVEVYEDTANDALVIVEVSGTEDTIVDAFDSAQAEIELNGDAPFTVTEEVPEIP